MDLTLTPVSCRFFGGYRWAKMVKRMVPAEKIPKPTAAAPDTSGGAFISTAGCGNGIAVMFKGGLLQTAAGLCLDTDRIDPAQENQLLNTKCVTGSATQMWS